MTVKEYMENELFMIGFEVDEWERAVQYAIRHINENLILPSLKPKIETKDGKYLFVENCWNTDADNYTEESLDGLHRSVKFHAMMWLLNELHSRK